MSPEDGTSVRVALRIRPQLAREKIEACRICTYVTPGEPQVTIGKDKSFTYDFVYDTPTEQHSVYESCVHSLVEGCFEGYNATVLAYGQTGSGKTYTMGTGFDVAALPEQLGIIPRAMENLFFGITKRKEEAKHSGLPLPEFTVSAQFLELYNEELIDLFDTSRDLTARGRSNIRIHEDANGHIYTVGVTSREVSSVEETMQCLHAGALNRTTAATQMNSQSSRSHAIFSVFMKQTRACKPKDAETNPAQVNGQAESSVTNGNSDVEFETLTAKFHFTDLAGSERLKRTGATGDRAKEGISINCGLLALGNVISALGDLLKRSSHVPYRDSKLTRLLQDSLGGNSCTLMVACISPSDSDFMETLSTLKYANRARNITNKVVANQDSASKQIQCILPTIQVLRQQLVALQFELTEYKTGKRIVGDDGVEAYNDMFQENNILQQENNNLRMKIKTMQETLENSKQRNVSLSRELVQLKMSGVEDSGDSNNLGLIEDYLKEIEDLRSKLAESEAQANVSRRSFALSPFRMHRSPTPAMSMTGLTSSMDFEPTLTNGKSVIELAKQDIDKLAAKKESLKKKKADKMKEEDKKASNIEVEGSSNIPSCEQSASEDEASEVDIADSTSTEGEDDEEFSEALQKELSSITYDIDVKQQLVNEIESQQRRIASMQRHYEDKLKLMAETIRATEVERDKVLKSLDSKSSGNSEKSKKIKVEYERQLDRMKKEMNKMQEVKKKHDRLMREQTKQTNRLMSLRAELDQMKKAKTRLMRQMKQDQKKNRDHESKRIREITKLKREFKMKVNEVRTLTSQNRQKELMMKRKQEELSILRKQLKPISGRYGKHQQMQQLKQTEGQRNPDSTFVVERGGGAEDKGGSTKRQRKASSEFSSRTARVKLKTLQSKIKETVLQRETTTNIDRQMERLLNERQRLQRDLERLQRKRSKAIATREDEATLQRFKEEEESLQENVEFVNEQIHQCQMEIMQIEEAMEDQGVVSSIVQYCSVNEARYMLENLISTTISKSAIEAHAQNRLKDMEARLQASEESAKQAHDLMRYILQERPNLDSSFAECLTEYMKGAVSDSSSSRESSPDRDGEDSFLDATAVLAHPPPPVDSSSSDANQTYKAIPKDVKARRSTATPQELLHGMPSPIATPLSPIDSPCEEKTFIITPSRRSPNQRVTSTPDAHEDANDTLTSSSTDNTLRSNGVRKKDSTSPPRPTFFTKDLSNSVAATKNNNSPTNLPFPQPSETPPGSPVSSRSKASVASNVFSRLTTYALSSPRTDKGRMNPVTNKAPTPRGAPLVCTHTAEGHHKPVLCVEATEHLLFTGSKDRTVKVWNLVTGQEIMTLSGHPNNVSVVRYCQATGLVYTVSLCFIKVWDIRSSPRCLRVLSSSGGHQLPSNFSSNVSRTNRMPDNESLINDVRLREDGKTLFCASTTTVKMWDLNKFALTGKLTGHSGNIMTMVVPRNKNNLVITGAKDHFIKVYDLSGGVQGIVNPSVTLEPPHMDGVESLAYSADENVLFSSSRDKSIKKWDMNTKAVIKSEYQAHSSWVSTLDITRSVDGEEVLVSGGRDGVIKLWDLKSFGSIGSINAHSDTVNYIASNRTNLFTASSDSVVRVWKRKQAR